MRVAPLALAFFFAVALAAIPASSAGCTVPHDSPTLTIQSVTSGSATKGGGATLGVPIPASVPIVHATTYYLVLDAHVWFVYEETNGAAGLQRGDYARDDTCGGQVEADVDVA